MHDPRIGRFFARDPLAGKYPHNSPYAFSENRVTNSVELEGLEAVDLTPSGGTINLPQGANVLKRYEANNSSGPVDGSSSAEYCAEVGSVRQFEYEGTTYSSVFSTKTGGFLGYHSQQKLDEQNYSGPDIAFNTGKMITSQSWGFSTEGSSQVAMETFMAVQLRGGALTKNQIGLLLGGALAASAYLANSLQLETNTWDFELTDAPAVPTTTTLNPPNAKIVFGTATHLIGLSNHVGGGLPWTSGWGKGVDFYSEKSVETALLGLSAIPGTTFHFSLAEDLSSSISSGRVDSPQNLKKYSWSSTTTEYQIIMNNPILRSITTFYDYKPGTGYVPTIPMSTP